MWNMVTQGIGIIMQEQKNGGERYDFRAGNICRIHRAGCGAGKWECSEPGTR